MLKKKRSFLPILRLLAFMAGAAALAACAVSSDTPNAFQTQAAADLRAMKALLPTIGAAISVLPDAKQTSRALDPTKIPNLTTTLGHKSPATVYVEYGGTGTNTVPVPSAGFFDDYYNTGNQMYFTIARDTLGTDYYRIKMYIYPRTDLNILYSYEEYIVNNANSWDWEYFDTNLNPSSYVKLETYYADGSKGTRTVAWKSSASDPRYYPAFDVPEGILTDLKYAYPASIPAQTFTGSGPYSSNTNTVINSGSRSVQSTEYYTETTPTAHSGISYITTMVKGRDKENYATVTRFVEDTTAGTKTVRSLTAMTSSKSGTPYTETNEVVLGKDSSGQLTYQSTMNGWNLAPEDVASNLGNTSILAIVRTATAPVTWTGTLTEYAGNSGTVYDVTLTANTDGSYAMTQTVGNATSRALSAAVTIDLKKLDAVSITLSASGASFSGVYEMGAFVGTYTHGGATADVDVSTSGIAVDEWYFKYD